MMRSMVDGSLIYVFPIILLIGSALALSGCADRPEVSPQSYGTVLPYLPDLEEAKKPFPFPMEGDNDHQHCSFEEEEEDGMM